VKLGVVALDYDGTIAEHGGLNPALRRAIAVVLVTGRIVDDVRRVAGDLRCGTGNHQDCPPRHWRHPPRAEWDICHGRHASDRPTIRRM